MHFSDLNPLAILVAAVAAFVLGSMWHGPLFGKQWMNLMGISQKEVNAMKAKGMGPMIPNMIGAFVQQIVIAIGFAHLGSALGLVTWMQAVMLAVFVWFCFIVTVLLNGVLWERRKMSLFLFNIVYQLVSLAVISLIVTLWK